MTPDDLDTLSLRLPRKQPCDYCLRLEHAPKCIRRDGEALINFWHARGHFAGMSQFSRILSLAVGAQQRSGATIHYHNKELP